MPAKAEQGTPAPTVASEVKKPLDKELVKAREVAEEKSAEAKAAEQDEVSIDIRLSVLHRALPSKRNRSRQHKSWQITPMKPARFSPKISRTLHSTVLPRQRSSGSSRGSADAETEFASIVPRPAAARTSSPGFRAS